MDLTKVDLQEPVDSNLLSVNECIKILKTKKNMLKLFEDVEKRLFETAKSGEKVPGFKLVQGVKHRRYIDENVARKRLITTFSKAEVIEEKLISPSKLDDLIASKPTMRENTKLKIYSLIEKPKGGPKLVEESDPRPEWVDEELLNKPVKKFW